MRYILTDEEMKAYDRWTIQDMGIPSLVLMERAALSCVDALYDNGFDLARVLVVCGTGNNGADGVAAARILHLRGICTEVWMVGNPEKFSPDLRKQMKIAENYDVTFVHSPDPHEYTTIVDALFGIGLHRNLEGVFAEAVHKINDSNARVLSVDVPSGVSGTTGAVLGTAVHADMTQTFAWEKLGLILYPGAAYAGKVLTADIGIYLPKGELPGCALTEDCDVTEFYGQRPDWGNKGTFGKILLLAGCDAMYGAAYLSASAALLSGAGMVKIHTARENADALRISLPEAMLSFYPKENTGEDAELEAFAPGEEWADLIAAGPGLGTSGPARLLVHRLLVSCEKPCVFDADALNIISEDTDMLRQRKNLTVITPHIGEMARLTGESPAVIKADPIACAVKFAAAYGVICVLKDARTVTAFPDGRVYLTASGNSGMATAGSGDVLTGIMAGMLAQRGADVKAVPAAVHFHGLCGTAAACRGARPALTAGEILRAVPEAMHKLGIF